MAFEHPMFLWGLLAALIPLAVHLFDRRKARPLPFAAIDFVLRSQKRTAQKLRLRRILLYTLRTLLLCAVPLALAKPHRAVAHGAAVPRQGPAATAIVLDASLSMQDTLRGQTLFAHAQDLARQALAGLTPEDPVTVVVCGTPVPKVRTPNFDRAAARRAIDEAQVTFAPANGDACLQAAASALAESPVAGKQIFFASDLTQGALDPGAAPPVISTPKGQLRPRVVLLDAARGERDLPNAAVTQLRVEPSPVLGARGYAFTFTVRNSGEAAISNREVALKIGGRRVVRAEVSVPAHGSTQKTLSYRFESGGVVHGAVALAADSLPADDARSFVLSVPRQIEVAVVDGAPSSVRFDDAAFFVDAALRAEGSPVHATTVDVDTFDSRPLPPGLDAVFLIDVPPLPTARVAELAAFVRQGGGLFVSLGPNAVGAQGEPDGFNASMAPLLPRPLRVVKTAVRPNDPGAANTAARFARVDWSHPALSIFTGDARQGFEAARTEKYFLLQPNGPSFRTLASYDDGAPAFVESALGAGKVVLDTTTVDRGWSNFPIQTAFLPLMQRLAGHLAGALDARPPAETQVGQVHAIASAGSGVTPAGVQGPDGKPRMLSRGAKLGWQVTGIDRPGAYTVSLAPPAPPTAAGALDFAVNVDPGETALRRIDAKALSAHFGEGTQTVGGATSGPARSRAPAWTGLLALAMAIFFFEGGLLAKG